MPRIGRTTPASAVVLRAPLTSAAPTGTVYPVTGTASGTSATSGTVSLRAAVTGTTAATSTTSGSATRVPRVYSVTGTAAATSTTSGSVTVLGAQPKKLTAVALPPQFAVRTLGDRFSARPADARFTIRAMAPRHSATTTPRYAVRSL